MRAILSGRGVTPLPSLACEHLETPFRKHARHMDSERERGVRVFFMVVGSEWVRKEE
jgi:hypothetical protein